MPSERRGTVTDDIAGYLQRIQGTSEWRADRSGNIRTPIALVSLFMLELDSSHFFFTAALPR